jgi:hypothetical protein
VANLRSLPGDDENEAKEGQVLYPRQIARYTRSAADRLPVSRKREIRREGFLGLSENEQDRRHVAKQQDLEDKAIETDTLLGYHAAIEYRTTNRNIDTVDSMEQKVFTTRPGTVTGAFAEDVLVDSAQRLRASQDEAVKLFLTEGTEIIRND